MLKVQNTPNGRDEGSIPFTRWNPLVSSDLLRLGELQCSRFVTDGDTDFLLRFWEKVAISDPGKCWEWEGCRLIHHRDNYGMFYLDGKMKRAHRMAYELTIGPIPDGQVVCHECDNPPCCNPNHLFLGTKKRNMEDAKDKARHAHGRRHGRAILDEDKVAEARRRSRAGESTAALALEFGVHEISMYNAVRGFNWKHVPMPT